MTEKHLTETPEFKEAVAKAASAAATEAVQELLAKHAGNASSGSDQSFIGGLALQLAELTGQGSGRVYVAPEVIRQRTAARERMVVLIMEARKSGKTPTYQLRNKVLLANRIIEPMWIAADHTTKKTEIDWMGVPNESMIPLNATAKAIHGAFMESIGNLEKVVPDDALGITPGGVVVRNGAVNSAIARRSAPDAATGNEAGQLSDAEEGLTVHHQTQPGRYVEKHILGTIQEPARQSA